MCDTCLALLDKITAGVDRQHPGNRDNAFVNQSARDLCTRAHGCADENKSTWRAVGFFMEHMVGWYAAGLFDHAALMEVRDAALELRDDVPDVLRSVDLSSMTVEQAQHAVNATMFQHARLHTRLLLAPPPSPEEEDEGADATQEPTQAPYGQDGEDSDEAKEEDDGVSPLV